jgi:hypothetical protein
MISALLESKAKSVMFYPRLALCQSRQMLIPTGSREVTVWSTGVSG